MLVELRSPTRILVSLLAVAGLATVVSGCSGKGLGPTPAASVNGVDISQDKVEGLAGAYTRYYQQAIDLGQDSDGQIEAALTAAQGAGTDTISMVSASAALEELINAEIVTQELERRDSSVTQADLDSVRASLAEQLGGADKLDQIDKTLLDSTIRSRASELALQNAIAAETDAAVEPVDPAERSQQLRDLYETARPTIPLCLNLIFVATEEEAVAAKARVDGGEALTAVAADVSLAGGVDEGGFGCLGFEEADTAFKADLSSLEVGAIAGPYSLDAGDGTAPSFVVVEVVSTDGPTYEQIAPRLEQQIPETPVQTDPTSIDLPQVVAKLKSEADVVVDPRFGNWNAETWRIDPPKVAGATTEPSAVLAPQN